MADTRPGKRYLPDRIGRLIIMTVIVLSSLGIPQVVRAESTPPSGTDISGNVLSDGEFVNGPNVANFDIRAYLKSTVPALARFADDLYGRADYYSINPKVYLTLLEVHAQLISDPKPARIDNPFNLKSSGFIAQIDEISNVMVSAYYLHLYSYSGAPGVTIAAPPIASVSGDSLAVSPDMNAGTYGLLAGLALIEKKERIPLLMDNNQADGFFQTYQRMFAGEDPTNERNHIYKPGDEGATSIPVDILQLQLPYLKGESWMFNGVHDAAGANDGDPFVNAAAIDFAPNWPPWGVDTSNMWVVAAGSGTPTKMSSCSVRIAHGDGWETGYYHLDKIPAFSSWIGQNEKIGVIADNLAQAICTGGFSTGPHVHFTLRRNGAYVAIDGTPLSGWYIHSGRWNYDDDPNYMWLERFGVKKFAFQPLLSESPALITQIITGAGHTCALIASGAPKCWGHNASGQVGDGTTSDRLKPVNVSGLSSGIAALAAGWNHTCALTRDGGIKCWGDNASGQLGDGTIITRPIPVGVSGFSSSGAQAVSAGQLHTCLLNGSNGIKCWGDNSHGQIGDGTNTNRLVPINVSGLGSGIKMVSAGGSHTCALTTSGAVKCWGENSNGQLGDGTTTNRLTAVNVTGLTSGVKAISASDNHTCALLNSGAVTCWGGNASGQLGDGSTTDHPDPVAVSGLSSGMVAIATGKEYSCALSSNGTVKCWGANGSGQLGDGSNSGRLTPVVVTGLLSGVVTIAAGGGEHTCALTSAGIAQCWGGNTFGQLGDGTTTSHNSAGNVNGLTYSLQLSKAGNGSGKVTSVPAGISCGFYCSATYISGTSITLSATGSTGSTFSGWSGEGCSGTGTCTVNMTATRSVTAAFTLKTFSLTTSKTGSGSISSAPAGINCGTDCSERYNYGTKVTLTAAPAAGWYFGSWGDRCLGAVGTTCTVVVDEDKLVSAVFTNVSYPLTIIKAGTGSGTVSSLPAGIDCGSTCTNAFGNHSLVSLTAVAATGSTFTGWSGGGCSGTGACTVNMGTAISVTATFTRKTFTLSTSLTGSGSLSSSPTGINCGTDCSEIFPYGTKVTLTALPAAGWYFGSWGDRCTGVVGLTCTVVVDEDKLVSARFTNVTYPLTLIKAGTGSGTVTSQPAGIDCGSTCSYAFGNHSLVSLTAVAAIGSNFTGWSGGGCSGTGVCTVDMGNATSVTATFATKTFTLTTSKTGSGTISSSPTGISCGTDCSESYNSGTQVTLTAVPDTGSAFSSWGDACLGTSVNVCILTMDADKTALANFTSGTVDLTISKTGNGSGTISSSPVGIDCGSTCSHAFDVGTVVTLSAAAAGGSTFTGWSGGGCSGSRTCVITMNTSTSVSASFDLPPASFSKSLPANGATNQPVSLLLSWTASAGASAYWFCIDSTNDNACTNWVNNGTATFKLKSGMTQNTTYYWQVRAVNAAGTTYPDGSATSFWSFKTGALPGVFSKTSPANGATDQPLNSTISWAASTGAISYWVCYDTSNDNKCSNWVSNGSSTSRVLSGLAQNTTYYWQVRAKNAIGITFANGTASSYWNFKTGVKPASFGKATPVNGATSQPLSLALSWSASTGASSYWLCYDTSNDNACTGWINNGTATSKTLSGLSAGTTYYWQVRAVNPIGTTYADGSNTSYWSFTTQAGGGPGAFNKLAPFNGSIGQPSLLTLSWGSSAGASAYFYCFDKTNDNACTTWIGIGMGTSTMLSDLTPNTIYYWQVRAVNATGTTYANGASTAFWNFKIAQ